MCKLLQYSSHSILLSAMASQTGQTGQDRTRVLNHHSRIRNHHMRIRNHHARFRNHYARITNHHTRIRNHNVRFRNHHMTIRNCYVRFRNHHTRISIEFFLSQQCTRSQRNQVTCPVHHGGYGEWDGPANYWQCQQALRSNGISRSAAI